MDDLDLLRDYANTGSSRSFALLVERYVDLVHSAALRRVQGDVHRAKEVTQMVFIDLARKAAQLSRHPLLVGWFHQSTRWAAANVLRAERRRRLQEEAAAIARELTADPGQPLDWESLRPMLDAAIDQLGESDREAVLLRYFSNYSFAEVASRIGVEENAARMRVERALEKLQRRLRRGGVTSSCAALAAVLSQNAVTAAPADLTATLAPASISAAGSIATLAAGTVLMFKIQLGVLVVIAAALALGLNFESTRRTMEEAALNALRTEQDLQRQEIARLGTRAAIAQQTLQSLPVIATAAPPDPIQLERKRLDVIIRKGELDREYAGLFRRLRLEPAVLDRLKGLLVERNQAIYDAGQFAQQEKLVLVSQAEVRELQWEATRSVDREMEALLGKQKFAQVERYLLTQPIRRAIETPDLTNDSEGDRRVAELVKIFEKTHPDYLSVGNGPASQWEAFLKNAKAVVSEETYDYLVSGREVLEAFDRMTAITRAAASEGKLKLKGSERDSPRPRPSKPGSASIPPTKSP
jgi:RNA polymerase sigma factor (sigma-70 family)